MTRGLPADYSARLGGVGVTCVVAFASGGTRFEWGGTLRRINLPHVLMRDSTDRWYADGVRGLGSSDAVVAYLEGLMRCYDRVVCLGLSSGAHAALMYGKQAGVDRVVAISPITGKGEAVRGEFAPEWHHRIEHGPEHPPVPDLRPMFTSGGLTPEVKVFVSDGEGTELDRQMAERIGVFPGDITFVSGYSHARLAAAVRDNGMLQAALR